jgi:hypothetical protein
LVYVPPGIENVGVAALGGSIVYTAEATALSAYPLAVAMAFNVIDTETVIAPLYNVDPLVGALPSTV